MTTVDRNWTFLALTIVALVAVGAAFAGGGDREITGLMIPVVLLIELVVYFIAAMVANARATIGMAFGTALVLMVLRGVCTWTGAILHGVASGGDSSLLMSTWVNPVAVIIQVVMLVMAGPYVLAIILPDLLGRDMADALLGGTTKATPAAKAKPGSLETSPTHGFIQVFSYEELAGVVKKIHGIEGFLLINNEGLVVWRDLPMRVNTDVLAARIYSNTAATSDFVEGIGLTKVRRVMVEARDHFLFSTTLDQNFNLLLIFNGRVAPEEIMSRIAIMSKTCREFLQWKYPSLPLKAGAVKELEIHHASDSRRG